MCIKIVPSIFQVYIIDSADSKGFLQLVRAREPGIEYYVEHSQDSFYILTNYPDGGNYQVCNFLREINLNYG